MPQSARAELVEALSFSFSSLLKKKQPFDKLGASGDRFTPSSLDIIRHNAKLPIGSQEPLELCYSAFSPAWLPDYLNCKQAHLVSL
jgi:hypothetical protein